MDLSKNIQEEMIRKYRRKLGCNSTVQVCWCVTCVTIENIVTDTLIAVKESIK